MKPKSGTTNPESTLKKVVFPIPESPETCTKLPSEIRSSTSRNLFPDEVKI